MKNNIFYQINVIPAKAGIYTNRSRIKSGMTIIILVFALIAAPTVHAQGISLSLDPPILEAIIKPGKNINQTFTIKLTFPETQL
ncbi:hypothetical protein HYS10_01345 [Candidatus Collierbacteria bacterium]|nr:hypothetical protein [Candidatus Collierbacteria bacterium]